MKITALLTGKKNSTFKNKNEIKIHNEYIFNYPAKQARKVKDIDFFYTSSDSEIILNQTKKIGYQIINRPKNLSRKDSKHIDVLKHALNIFKKKNQYPDILIVLLANAPIVKSKWIHECIQILKKNKNITSVVPVQNINDHHPERAKQIKNGVLKNFINKKKISSNRQDLSKCFFLCHNFWVIRTREIFKNNGQLPWSFMGKKVKAYEIKSSIDIHSAMDVEIAKFLIKNEKLNKKYF
jgi:CMP-N,N'-diacetyllegionaminic acid synthase